jgi:hypothetical protein
LTVSICPFDTKPPKPYCAAKRYFSQNPRSAAKGWVAGPVGIDQEGKPSNGMIYFKAAGSLIRTLAA